MALNVHTIYLSIAIIASTSAHARHGSTLGDSFGRGAAGDQGQQVAAQNGQQGQQQNAKQGATGGAGGGGGGDVKYEKRKNPNDINKIGEEAIKELKKADEKFSGAVDKLSQSFVSSLAALKPPPDDPALMKQLGEDLAKRKELSDKEPTIGGAIIDDIVKATKDRSDLSVEQVKQVALQLQPPPAQPNPPPAPKLTVADRIKQFAGNGGSTSSGLSGNALGLAAAAGNDRATIPGKPGTSRGATSTPERMETGRGATADSGSAGSGNFPQNNFAVRGAFGSSSGGGPSLASSLSFSSPSSATSASGGSSRGIASTSDDDGGSTSRGNGRPRAINDIYAESSGEPRSMADLLKSPESVEGLPTDEKNSKKNPSKTVSLRRLRGSRAARNNSLLQQVKEKLETAEVPKQAKSVLVPSKVSLTPSKP